MANQDRPSPKHFVNIKEAFMAILNCVLLPRYETMPDGQYRAAELRKLIDKQNSSIHTQVNFNHLFTPAMDCVKEVVCIVIRNSKNCDGVISTSSLNQMMNSRKPEAMRMFNGFVNKISVRKHDRSFAILISHLLGVGLLIIQALVEIEDVSYHRLCQLIDWLFHHLMYTREPSWSRYLEDNGGLDMLTNLPLVRGGTSIFSTQQPFRVIPPSISSIYQSLADVAAEVSYLVGRIQDRSYDCIETSQRLPSSSTPRRVLRSRQEPEEKRERPQHRLEEIHNSELVRTGIRFLDAVFDSPYK